MPPQARAETAVRFSSRLDWTARPNRLAELLRSKRTAGVPILDLTESNPTRAGLDYDRQAILGPLTGEALLAYQPHPAGSGFARRAVADYYAARGYEVDPGRIILTAGTSEAYGFLFKLLADAGDEVLVPRPSYPLFEYLARLEGVRVRQYRLVYDYGWRLDLDSVRAALGERTRAIVAVSPNNPTGHFPKPSEQEALVALCAERGLALITDEVFFDYPFGTPGAPAPSTVSVTGALSFTLNGLSKVAGLPQMKLAWMVVNGPPALRQAALVRLELIADTYLTVGTPAQEAAGAWLEWAERFQRQLRARLHDNLAHLRSVLAGTPAGLLECEGGWYAILRLPRTRSDEEWALELLRCEDVLTQPGYFYDFDQEACLVVSLLVEPGIFREGIGRLLAQL